MGRVPAGGGRAGPRRNRAHEHLLLGRLVRRADGGDPRPPRHDHRQGELPLRRAHGPAPLAAVCRQGDPCGGRRARARDPHGGPRRGRNECQLRCPPRMGRRRLCGGVRAPAPRPGRAPPAGTRTRGRLVRHRPRRPRASGGACDARADPPAGHPEGSDPNRRIERRRTGANHGGRRRCRHPEPDPLCCARSGRVFLRPAAALHRDPRPLRLSHRWHAGHPRHHPLGRGHGRRDRGVAARPGAARALLRHRRGRTRRHRAGRIRHPGLQRHGPRDGGGVDGRPGRPRRLRGDRARSRRGVGDAPPFPLGRRSIPLLHADRQCGRAGGRLRDRPRHQGTDRRRGRRAAQPREAGSQRTRRRVGSHRGGRRRHGDRRRDDRRSGSRGGSELLAARSARELVAGAPRRPPPAERREPDRLAGSPRRGPARHRRGLRLRVAARRARRAGPSPGTRPLSLRLHRADREPRPAAPLCEPPLRPRSPGARRGHRRAGPAEHRARAEPAGLRRLIRPLVAGRRRPLARRLRGGLPHPRPRTRLRGAAES